MSKVFEKATKDFYREKENLKIATERFEEIKKNYYELASKNVKEEKLNFSDSKFSFYVNKVVSKKVSFDIKKLKNLLTKEQQKKVIVKSLIVADSKGLIDFLKAQNVDMEKLKEFVNVDLKVNEKALDKLADLGEVDVETLKKEKCFEVAYGNPYFKVTRE